MDEDPDMARRQRTAVPPAEKDRAGYDRDFYTWSQQQGRLVREGRWNEVARENIAEEIESWAREQFDKLKSEACLYSYDDITSRPFRYE